MLAALVTCCLLLPDVHTVDDDGPADFPDIASAVAAVPAGDTLLVAAGTYGPFVLTHSLTVASSTSGPLPRVLGATRIAGAADVTLVGLRFQRLGLLACPGPIVLRDGAIGDPVADPGNAHALSIRECPSVVISRVDISGSASGSFEDPVDALVISRSNVALNHAVVRGAEGYSPPAFAFTSDGGPGGIALRVCQGSRVWLAATNVFGGSGGWGSIPFAPSNGPGGNGLEVHASQLVVCGSSEHQIRAGWSPSSPGAPTTGSVPLVLEDAHARVSGVQLTSWDPYLLVSATPVLLGDSTIELPEVADPFVVVEGGVPGSDVVVAVFRGRNGARWLAGVGPVAGPQLGLPGVGTLWIPPLASMSTLFEVRTFGQDVPVSVVIPADWLVPGQAAHAVQLLHELGAVSPLVVVPDVFVRMP